MVKPVYEVVRKFTALASLRGDEIAVSSLFATWDVSGVPPWETSLAAKSEEENGCFCRLGRGGRANFWYTIISDGT